MTFQSDKYQIIRGAISKELAAFVSEYFLLKRRVADTMYDHNFLTPDITDFGVYNDGQVPDTYSHYADIVMETLLDWVKPTMERHTCLMLTPTYSYARIYKKGDVLPRHTDRSGCEISTTMNLGGEPWSIYLEPEIKIDLEPGDMLIYSGCELEHWRNEFQGETCIQVFLHYSANGTNRFDGRPHLGLSEAFNSINRMQA